MKRWGASLRIAEGGRLSMYQTHFGFTQRPFRSTPDCDLYYPATGHERVLSGLMQSVQENEGLMLLTGGCGTGKTLIAQLLLEQFDESGTSIFLTHSNFSDRRALLQAILFDLALPYDGKTEQELRLRLTEYLLENFSASKRTLLLVDEAQHLTAELLEELRLWSNLQSSAGQAMQTVLIAAAGWEQQLTAAQMPSLCQRLRVRLQLEPLEEEEAADYLVHQLRVSGGRPEQMITDEALEIIVRAAKGIPRQLNQAAHQALTLAFLGESNSVDAEAALEAVSMLGLDSDSVDTSSSTLIPKSSTINTGFEPTNSTVLPMAIETAEGLSLRSEEIESEDCDESFYTPRRPA